MIVTNFEGSPHLRPEKRNLNLNIKITADSTCDLSAALLAQWNISLIPMIWRMVSLAFSLMT